MNKYQPNTNPIPTLALFGLVRSNDVVHVLCVDLKSPYQPYQGKMAYLAGKKILIYPFFEYFSELYILFCLGRVGMVIKKSLKPP